ncbi:MAG: (Fe-S)-binding protein [Geobacteraceae bacterium]|nr:(Fe-S)-binding protein [Geobacteraceae bacterium]
MTIAQRGTTASNLLAAYRCSLCGLCDGTCPCGLTPSSMFLSMRRVATERAVVDLKTYASWLNYERLGGSVLFRRYLIPEGSTCVFFPGCALPGARPDAVISMFRKLRQVEPFIGLVLDCCGRISHDLGLSVRHETIFAGLSKRLRDKGISRVLTSCPGCSKVLRKYGKDFEITSIYEVLSSSAPLPVCHPKASVVVHDPCPARSDNLQQRAVRQLVQSCGYQVEEMPQNGRTTRCCGQGGMVAASAPGVTNQASRVIAAEAAGKPIITSCASCCETLSNVTHVAHVVDLLTGTEFENRPLSSASRWFNRLKLRLSRIS